MFFRNVSNKITTCTRCHSKTWWTSSPKNRKGKGKFVICMPQRHRGSRGITPLILNLPSNWRWVVCFTSRLLYFRGKSLRCSLNTWLWAPPKHVSTKRKFPAPAKNSTRFVGRPASTIITVPTELSRFFPQHRAKRTSGSTKPTSSATRNGSSKKHTEICRVVSYEKSVRPFIILWQNENVTNWMKVTRGSINYVWPSFDGLKYTPRPTYGCTVRRRQVVRWKRLTCISTLRSWSPTCA
jgi:hypothetical protein